MDVGSSHQLLPTVTETAVEEPMVVEYPSTPGMWLCDHVCRTKCYQDVIDVGQKLSKQVHQL